MKATSLIVFGVLFSLSGGAAFADGVGSGTDFPYPTQWSMPQALPNGMIVPSVPTKFERRSLGTSMYGSPTVVPSRPVPQLSAGDLALLQAAAKGDAKSIPGLLAKGAHVNCADGAGETPLMKAAAVGSVPAVTLLLDKGAEINEVSKAGQTALIIAARYGQGKVCELLLARKADPNVLDEAGKMAADYTAALRPAAPAKLPNTTNRTTTR